MPAYNPGPSCTKSSFARISLRWRKHRHAVQSSGYVAHSLEAALWAIGRTANFRDAVLLAANLGGDADTTAAITGQLAGALYGLSTIPEEWLERLAWRDKIEHQANDLFQESLNPKTLCTSQSQRV
jgi:ADP-ribosyl-[dinitrogen reductase] hydrolase